jgi:hypothetical protein
LHLMNNRCKLWSNEKSIGIKINACLDVFKEEMGHGNHNDLQGVI